MADIHATLRSYRHARDRYLDELPRLVAESDSLDWHEQAEWDERHSRIFDPLSRARKLLHTAAALEHGLLRSDKIERPLGVFIDGALLVIGPNWDDENSQDFHVVEPGDVVTVDRPHRHPRDGR